MSFGGLLRLKYSSGFATTLDRGDLEWMPIRYRIL
jgi:hypothetical protein